MLDRIGDEKVRAPGVAPDDGDALLITRRELLARVLWTRAIVDADNASTKLVIEYLDGKPGETEGAAGSSPPFLASLYSIPHTVAWHRNNIRSMWISQ
jgi:hypothetical protein